MRPGGGPACSIYAKTSTDSRARAWRHEGGNEMKDFATDLAAARLNLSREARSGIEEAFLRIIRVREPGAPVHPLRDDLDTLTERPAPATDDDSGEAAA